MITTQAEVTINRPVGAVFAFIADPRNDSRWQPDVVDASCEGDNLVFGATLRWVLAYNGGPLIETVARVTGFEPNRLVEIEARGGGLKQAITYLLDGDDASTWFRRSVALEAGLSPIRERTLRPLIATGNRQYVEKLKVVVESSPLDVHSGERRTFRDS